MPHVRHDVELLKQARLTKDLTQQQIAIAVGVSRTTVRKWEAGQCSPRARHVPKLCRALDLAPHELIPGEGAARKAVASQRPHGYGVLPVEDARQELSRLQERLIQLLEDTNKALARFY